VATVATKMTNLLCTCSDCSCSWYYCRRMRPVIPNSRLDVRCRRLSISIALFSSLSLCSSALMAADSTWWPSSTAWVHCESGTSVATCRSRPRHRNSTAVASWCRKVCKAFQIRRRHSSTQTSVGYPHRTPSLATHWTMYSSRSAAHTTPVHWLPFDVGLCTVLVICPRLDATRLYSIIVSDAECLRACSFAGLCWHHGCRSNRESLQRCKEQSVTSSLSLLWSFVGLFRRRSDNDSDLC